MRRKRHSYSRVQTADFQLPDLVEIQKQSFEKFLDEGITRTLREISPINDYTNSYAVEFGEHHFEEPKDSVEECMSKDKTYAASLSVRVRVHIKETGEIREGDVFMGDFPLMTESGTFIINGTERVVVTQLVRSPGAYVMEPKDATKQVLTASLMPARGSWLEFEVETKGYVSVRIDRKRKLPVTVLLKALDMGGPSELMERFEDSWLIRNTLERDDTTSREDALLEVFRRQRPGEPVNVDNAENLIETLFFDPKRYDLSAVGRYKVNKKLKVDVPEDQLTLTVEDIEALLKRLIRVAEKMAEGEEDFGRISYERYRVDLDEYEHFGNRRLRTVGELIQESFRIGMYRMERVVRERMTSQDEDAMTAQTVINTKPVQSAVKEFFGSSQLSQFMDQTNTLSGLSHRRRLSAMGAGGLSRERAPIEVRDVHPTHYGRMCPIETPEGPNIGLIGQLSTFAAVDDFGFLQTPYRRVEDGKVTDEIVYLSADEEEEHIIAQANTPIDPQTGEITEEQVLARERGGDVSTVERTAVDYMDVAPLQVVSVGTALIPFLEHDDANRALMGANMQRQAVPLLRSEAPYVGTGMEFRAATDTGDVVIAQNAGTVERVSAEEIQVRLEDDSLDTYKLRKFGRSNQGTLVNQRPLVREGETVEAGTIMADGSSTEEGELALGKNLLVAFMPWEGFNFEDAIIISERLVKDDVLSSIHIEEYEVQARDTKLGPEEITRDIPNASDEVLMNLDSEGIIRIGAEVNSGDVLVGKVTPKGESEPTPEEKLLRAIFGEKAREVKDSSLKVPHGEGGVVIDVKKFNREDGDELQPGVNEQVRVFVAKKRKISEGDKLAGRHGNKGVISKIVPEEDMPYMADGRPVDVILSPLGVPSRMNIGQILETHLGFAASRGLGENGGEPVHVATPVFSGAEVKDIDQAIEKVRTEVAPEIGMGKGGKVTLYDGRTGEPFDGRITVGYMYILKLLHLVDDKIHARSTGPYSLVTQQPLGGKAQFGGQRFGEMEVWALEAYGAAHTLQELLTIKSDDRVGRVKSYESIVKGENIPEPGVPASFKVLLKEMQSLGLSVKPIYDAAAAVEGDSERRDWDEAARALGINLSREEPTGNLDDTPDRFSEGGM
ncbi:DNA-directed RNA polymerase subunit beta [Rubrobacter radiotolerans]|uniref:DNA-directed RNA polymerase subunit beta n=1 Tax=Rubrobacter radiotolerans TaxID=42256 RepID=A0AB35T4P8_RUBRA|nr:DNA-directed RNA polymerase subunit beta [Rubrobacter radiotolerans]MDX5894636.1 DNA-directed RNA polymerase subunit beta [Rubrobacter radiotolerans]